MVTVERCQLWKYSVWDREELQERGLGWEVKGEMGQPPPALLLLYVSDAQAVAVQEDLRELSIKQALEPPTGESLPFGTKLCVSVARYTKTFLIVEREKNGSVLESSQCVSRRLLIEKGSCVSS